MVEASFGAASFGCSDDSVRQVRPPREKFRSHTDAVDSLVDIRSTNDVSSAEQFAELGSQLCRSHEQSRRERLTTDKSFREYLLDLWNDPRHTVRSVGQYQVDAFEHYGFEEKKIAGRVIKDFNARTFPWQSPDQVHRRELVGQEVGTYGYYEFCKRVAEDARPRSILCVHGHSGSGKSTFFQMRDEMLEDYSNNHPEGALYRLVWRFSESEASKFGFSIGDSPRPQIVEKGQPREVLIRADNNTDPIFVIPNTRPTSGQGRSPREELLYSLESSGRISEGFSKDYFLSDGLDPLSRQILDHLLNHYDGDMGKILDRHVKIERWGFSTPLGEGIVSLKPNPDQRADIKPISQPQRAFVKDPALETLPELQSTSSLFLHANRGVLHFADMFRPNQQDRSQGDITRFNYLLDTLETGSVQVLSHRDATVVRNIPSFVFVTADTNDHNILEKMQSSGFEQLRERMEFLTFGLITRCSQEARLYELAKGGDARYRPSPHAFETLALFACSTRLLVPDPLAINYGKEGLSGILNKVSPVSKALLLDEDKGATAINLVKDEKEELTADQTNVLSRYTSLIAEEYSGGVGQTKFWLYDGSLGLSTRSALGIAEKMIAQHHDRSLTAMDVCQHLAELIDGGLPYFADIRRMKLQVRSDVEQKARAEGLKLSESDFISRVNKLVPVPEPAEILSEVTTYAKRIIRNDLNDALGLSTEADAERALLRYVWHLRSYLTSGDQQVPEAFRLSQMRNDGRASELIMSSFEDTCLDASRPSTPEAREALRRSVFSKIAAWSLDNPETRLDEHIGQALSAILREVRLSGRANQKRAFDQFLDSAGAYGRNDGSLERDLQSGDQAIKKRAEYYFDVLTNMERFGYQRESASREIVWALTSDD
jgi:predicted Ser/Thr protein kinase